MSYGYSRNILPPKLTVEGFHLHSNYDTREEAEVVANRFVGTVVRDFRARIDTINPSTREVKSWEKVWFETYEPVRKKGA